PAGSGRRYVFQLLGQVRVALFELAAFGIGQGVRRTDLLEAPLQPAHLALAGLAARHLFWRDTVRHAGADLFHPRLQQLGLAGDQLHVAFEVARAKAGVDPGLFEGDQALGALRHLGLVLRGVVLGGGQRLARALGGAVQVRNRFGRGGHRLLGLNYPRAAILGHGRQAGEVLLHHGCLPANRIETVAHLAAFHRLAQAPQLAGRVTGEARLYLEPRHPPLPLRPARAVMTSPSRTPEDEAGRRASMPSSSERSLARATAASSATFARLSASASSVSATSSTGRASRASSLVSCACRSAAASRTALLS